MPDDPGRCVSACRMPPYCRVMRHTAYFRRLKHKHCDRSTHAKRAGVFLVLLTCLLVLAGAGAPALGAQITVLDRDAHYPKGPLWRNGKLLYVEYSTSNIKAWNGTRSSA